VRLLYQNPKYVALPIRGGFIFGDEVESAAHIIANKRGRKFHHHPIWMSAQNISRDENVEKKVESQLRDFCGSVEECRRLFNTSLIDEFYPLVNDVTIIETAYIGFSYAKLLDIFRRVLPNAKVNGILAQDEAYITPNLKILELAHRNMNNGDFFYVRAPLIFEDQPTTFHRDPKATHPSYFWIPTYGYTAVRKRVEGYIDRRIEQENETLAALPAVC
jgi:hypothetical protein